MKQIILSLCLVISAGTADKPGRTTPNPSRKAQPGPKVQPQRLAQPRLVPLPGRTVKLEFKLKGEEEETFVVLSSGGEYASDQSHSGPDFEQSLGLSGNVEPIVDAMKMRFTYSVTEMHEDLNEGNMGQFTLKGSAVLKFGKETVLGRLGGRMVVLIATVNE